MAFQGQRCGHLTILLTIFYAISTIKAWEPCTMACELKCLRGKKSIRIVKMTNRIKKNINYFPKLHPRWPIKAYIFNISILVPKLVGLKLSNLVPLITMIENPHQHKPIVEIMPKLGL